MNLDFSMHRETTVVGFFVHMTLNNYGSSGAEKAVKRDLRNIFMRQISKTLIH